jgi:hypothetical protein
MLVDFRFGFSLLQAGSGDGVIVKHPEAGTIPCQEPPTICQGKCCGTCQANEEDLVRMGMRLTMVREWATDGMLSLQFRLTRSSLMSGVNIKCGC